jgi:hypothetical protein
MIDVTFRTSHISAFQTYLTMVTRVKNRQLLVASSAATGSDTSLESSKKVKNPLLDSVASVLVVSQSGIVCNTKMT